MAAVFGPHDRLDAYIDGLHAEARLPSEDLYWRKVILAVIFNEPDQAVWDRQSRWWLADLTHAHGTINSTKEQRAEDKAKAANKAKAQQAARPEYGTKYVIPGTNIDVAQFFPGGSKHKPKEPPEGAG